MKNINIFEQLQFDLIRDDCSLSESKVSARKQYYGLICTIVFNSKSFLCKLNILYCHVYQKKSTDPVLLMVYLNNPATVCKVCFGFCFMSFILKFRHGSLMSFMLLVPLFMVSCFDWLS